MKKQLRLTQGNTSHTFYLDNDPVDDLHNNFQQSIKMQFLSKLSMTIDHFKADNGNNILLFTCHFVSSL